MDKYEEFKKWFKEQEDYGLKNNFTGRVLSNEVFKRFEKELEEKQKEKEIKNIISNIYSKNYYAITIREQAKVTRLYNELKDGGYLK